MKKVLVVLLVLFVGAGLFAQEITPFGSLRLDFGGKTTVNDGDTSGSYIFNALNSGTNLGFNVEADGFTGSIQVNAGDYSDGILFEGWGKAVIADVAYLKFGNGHLPSAFWSPAGVLGESNWSIGATNIGLLPYFQIGYASDTLDIHIGAASPLDYVNENHLDSIWTPIFFLGAEYSAETFAVGATFNGQLVKEGDGGFPILATVHGKMGLSEAIAIGVNVGFYMAPGNFGIDDMSDGEKGRGPGLVRGQQVVSGLVPYMGGIATALDKAMVVEAMIFAQLSFGDISLTPSVGFIDNLASKDDGGESMALQVALGVPIKLNDNVKVVPGVIYYNPLKSLGEDGKQFTVKYGASLSYSF